MIIGRLGLWVLSICARLEYLWHFARFHETGCIYCLSKDDTPAEDCAGHLVCTSCNLLFWNREHDPWRRGVDNDEDDVV